MMKRCLLLSGHLLLCLFLSNTAFAQSDETAVDHILNDFHQAAAMVDWLSYFDLMSDDAVFLGTDASERWSKAVFQEYANASSGWVYIPRERHINLSPDGTTAWFDEILDSASYGTSRGTGVLLKTADGWKISQYHLTFPIPNALARKFTDEIKAWEADQ